MRTIFLASILLLISTTAYAAGPAAPPQTGQQQATRIETDEKTGAIRFIVNGREEARIDAKGLHVRQDVAYGGSIADVGVATYDKASPEPKP